jgi:HlyD family secretion protein
VRSNVLTLPKEAVVHAAGPAAEAPNGRFVFVIEDGVVHRRSVEVGISSATRFEILSGVRAGQKVAVPGDRRLEEGMKVKVVA